MAKKTNGVPEPVFGDNGGGAFVNLNLTLYGGWP
jgi:hypothetical protein